MLLTSSFSSFVVRARRGARGVAGATRKGIGGNGGLLD